MHSLKLVTLNFDKIVSDGDDYVDNDNNINNNDNTNNDFLEY